MKLVNFEVDAAVHVGMIVNDEIVDLTLALDVRPADIAEFLGMGEETRALAQRSARHAPQRINVDSAKIRSPLLRAGKILGVGMNFRSCVEAADRLGMKFPPHRLWFYRPGTCIAGPFDGVWLPRGADDLDYEVELVMVIGRHCRYVTAADAPLVIAGFTIGNDLTLRNRVTKSPVLGKSFDTHLPLGPCIVTPEEVNPHALAMKTWVNGILRQESTTAEMIADCYELIADISTSCTLVPGDIILTGTPAGSGIFHRPALALLEGDVVKMEIAGIGVIENRIIAEPTVPALREPSRWRRGDEEHSAAR
jgi:2-keto-4-pentenoate hydratase/2-oxohepta-3-ene-1,7-dioic acid hydratase in catechol pathway